MANWDPVPWFVGGGALHSAEVARLVAYMAFNGNEGIVEAPDLAVRELAVPGSAVRVMPGACAIHNRAVGGEYQAYAGRLPTQDQVSIGATDSSGPRSDLIVAQAENPHIPGEPYQQPADPTVGPYIFTRVIPDVPSTTRSVRELVTADYNPSAITLARVDMPVSTATVAQSYITPLRFMANPRRLQLQRIINLGSVYNPDALQSTTYEVFPDDAYWWIDPIPPWAVRCQLFATISGMRLENSGNHISHWRIQHGQMYSPSTYFNQNEASAGHETQSVIMAGDQYIPKDHRDTKRDLSIQAYGEGVPYIYARPGTSVYIQVTYYEDPDAQWWEQ